MLLATDLDGTFLGGSDAQRRALYDLIDSRPDFRLAYVTGRALKLVEPLFQDPAVAQPEFVICDVGATIVDPQRAPLEPIQSGIQALWPGEADIVKAIAALDANLERQEQPQERRVSYYCRSSAVTPELETLVRKMNLDLLYSADHYLDVLPKGVNKGSTLKKLVQHLGLQPDEVLVAGDTLNDLSMYGVGFLGVCVGESEQGLLDATRGNPRVHHAREPGAGGIHEAMKHFGFI